MGPSFSDTIFLFLLALIIFGPKRLPEIGRQIGKVLNELKRASNEFKAQIQTEMDQMERQENAKKLLEPTAPPAGSVATLPPSPDAAAAATGKDVPDGDTPPSLIHAESPTEPSDSVLKVSNV